MENNLQKITKKAFFRGEKIKELNKLDKFSTILLYIEKEYGIIYCGFKGNFELYF